ncbi:DNA helicase [Herbidospora galbida]|uniref:DNA helicase n=1 Tax=Herbidospora galbida TaxID=2575442 RepID=A0A4U3MA21_9ACTN|nr:helicase-related protein [Herbidospora galbida]TKK85801.1 DNA helicase [Herbidospora galbida]
MPNHSEHYAFRSALAEQLRLDAIGPVGGPEEILKDSPVTTYAAGVLYPRRRDTVEVADEIGERDGDLAPETRVREDPPDTGVSLANDQAPSSMGLTFGVDPTVSPTITVTATAAMYAPFDTAGRPVRAQRAERRTTEEQDLRWHRRSLDLAPYHVDVLSPRQHTVELGPGLELRVRVRPVKDRAVSVTVALLNVTEVEKFDIRDASCVFQPEIRVSGAEGTLPFVERRVPVGADESEMRTNRLLYRYAPNFAVGHGCAADWDWTPPAPRDEALLRMEPAAVGEIRSEFVPAKEVLLTDSNPDIDNSALRMIDLAKGSDEEILTALRALVSGYRAWIAERAEESRLLGDVDFAEAAREQVRQCNTACARMDAGITTLRDNPMVMRAFRLANEAMANQRAQTGWIRNGRAGAPDNREGRWRPFQIAFLLLCLNGIDDPEHDDRGIADLLWFPTGGGKTEAYLGIIAFTVFLRRLRKGEEGGGVTAIMRYTLRLLTLQQFERAAALICAMEIIRSGNPRELGKETISIGMWVGAAATPNKLKDAAASLEKLRSGKELHKEDPVQLRFCPWCGTPMGPDEYVVDVAASNMRIFCANGDCAFHHELPVYVVDEKIYAVRPTLIIATVDKFAQIAWKPEVAALFNRDRPGTAPPELIVQDELHLISGPLGSLTGLYETAIDEAAERPKIVASTATIRRAKDQVKRLFNREVAQFPPAGLDARDSWFAVETPAKDKASRLYVGLLAPNTSQATLLVRAYGALLHHATHIEGEDSVRDAYWTLVGYFNSLRLLAAAELQVLDDVQDRLKVLAERHGITVRPRDHLTELTSRVKSSEIPKRLKDLERRHPDPEVFDAVLATNMISVGVDVSRLGLMAITGQPQTTAEYIQSSSRVGREHPGLVVMLYNANRSRDRSHYESFVSYHSALYRQVESTSVTPFSPRARDRALHAVLVGMARLLQPELRFNHAAASVLAHEHRIEELKDLIVARARAALEKDGTVDEVELAGVEKDLDELIADWITLADENDKLVYQAKARFKRSERRNPHEALLRSFTDDDLDYAWDTLWSLRDVDAESDLYLER